MIGLHKLGGAFSLTSTCASGSGHLLESCKRYKRPPSPHGVWWGNTDGCTRDTLPTTHGYTQMRMNLQRSALRNTYTHTTGTEDTRDAHRQKGNAHLKKKSQHLAYRSLCSSVIWHWSSWNSAKRHMKNGQGRPIFEYTYVAIHLRHAAGHE